MSHLRFIKLSVVVEDAFPSLKGAPFGTFFALAVNEAKISLGQSPGLSAHAVAAKIGYGLRATQYALDYLCRHQYATKLEARGELGETLYRVSAYAWFGNPPPHYEERNPARECAPDGNCRGMHPSAPVVVVNSRSIAPLREAEQQQAHSSASRAIFAAGGVAGPPLEVLARTVDPELAREWTERLEDAPRSIRDPVALMIARLAHDPTARPSWAKRKPKSLIDDEFAKFVHGRPEHTQYCREHPEEVDCDCGKELPAEDGG
ncbi:MAG: hypothetical protein ACM3S0_05075 [Acidobacteriota bacterium]